MQPFSRRFDHLSESHDASPTRLSHGREFDHLSTEYRSDLYRAFGPRVEQHSLLRRWGSREFLNSSNDKSESRAPIVDTKVMKDWEPSRRAHSLRSRNVLLNHLLGPVPVENNNFVSKEDTSDNWIIRDNNIRSTKKRILVVDDVIGNEKVKVNILRHDCAKTPKMPQRKQFQKGTDGFANVDLCKVREKLDEEFFPPSSVLDAAIAMNRQYYSRFERNSGRVVTENEPPAPIFRSFNPNEDPRESSFKYNSSEFPPLSVKPR